LEGIMNRFAHEYAEYTCVNRRIHFDNGDSTLLWVDADEDWSAAIVEMCEREGWDVSTVAFQSVEGWHNSNTEE
jgi:hypothetical protein